MNNSLSRIVITGASSGIGKAIASRLSHAGSTIANLDRLDGTETSSRCAGRFQTIQVDLSDAQAIPRAFNDVDTFFGGKSPDVLVCCAALSRPAQFLDVSVSDLDLMMAVNIRGTFIACQQAGLRMRRAGRGRIVIITSICALQGWAQESVYCMTKAAQQAMVQSLAVELAPHGILVNGVAPGLISSAGDSMAKTRSDPHVYQHDMERTSLGRFGTAEEVAEAVAYLTTVTWMTGQSLVIDGGFMATGLGYLGESREKLIAKTGPRGHENS